ncbi:hypothetical protein [uncultured Methanospirillum sp.]|uniref:hypothetical protein n=1 Tax=uncultured Methanospirillum sp. TaxID=262503 RepID=UPI0029C72574|nr:hypothetical protein [uncultured Methanospirillum sp.]
MTKPTDIRDETCTNLSLLLNLLIRNIKPGEEFQVITTRRQLVQIEEVLRQNNIDVEHESLPEDLLVTISRSE